MGESMDGVVGNGEKPLHATSRRAFLRLLGASGAVVLLPSVFAACEDGPNFGTNPQTNLYTLDLSNDTGILNYAYAIAQVEAAFYTAAITSAGFAEMSTTEQEVLTDLQKHEVIHREFYKLLLGTSANPTIAFNATTIGRLTATRTVLLATSQFVEDVGVSAYNGAGKYLTSAANLVLTAKIGSVEERQSAAIRDVRDGTNGRLFAGDDVVVAGLDVKAEPDTVVSSLNDLGVIDGMIRILKQPDQSKATPDRPAPNPA